MIRFFAAAFFAALVVLGSDRYAGEVFFRLGSILASDFSGEMIAASYFYKAFTWACMFAVALVMTPEPKRNWPSAVVCGLALAVGLYQTREIALFTIANGQSVVFGWIAILALFAAPLWLTWEWYRRIIPRLVA